MKKIILLFLLPMLCSCEQRNKGIRVEDLERPSNPEAFLEGLFQQDSALVFISREGHVYGMDSDTKVILSSDGQAALTEYGLGISTYKGKYRFAEDGTLNLDLNGYQGNWPPMVLLSKETDVYLHPADNNNGFIFGGRGAASETADMLPFWPFKLVKSKSESDT